MKGRFARPAADGAPAGRAHGPREREAWLLNCDWTHGFLVVLLGAAGIVAWPLLWTDVIDHAGRILGALFFLGLALETLLIRSKLRAAVAMEIYGGIFLDRTGSANTRGPVVLGVALAHAAVTVAGSLLALSAIGETWARPTVTAIAVMTIVVCRAVYLGFTIAAPGEGPGSGAAGAMLLELGGALYAAVFAMLLWSTLLTDPNDWAIKAAGRPSWQQALVLCAPAVVAVFVLRAPIALIERRSLQSVAGRIIRWFLLLLAALSATSPVALLAI